jgi:hypothetical protein
LASLQGKNRDDGVRNRVLKRIFGPKRDEVAEGWKKLHNEELHSLCSSPNTAVIKSRIIRWLGM